MASTKNGRQIKMNRFEKLGYEKLTKKNGIPKKSSLFSNVANLENSNELPKSLTEINLLLL